MFSKDPSQPNPAVSESEACRYAIVALVFVAGCALGAVGAVAGRTSDSGLDLRLEAQERQLRELSTNLDRLLSRSGDVTASAATEVDRSLCLLERRVAEESSWPKDGAGAKALRTQLQTCVDRIPPAAQDTLLPRIVPLRWGTEVLCHVGSLADQDPEEALANARALRNARPRTGSEALARKLTELIRKLELEAEETAVREAEKALAEGDVRRVEAELDALAGATEPKLRDLRAKLEARRRQLQAEEKVAILLRAFEAGKAAGNDTLRAAQFARVFDAATGVLMDLEIDRPRIDSAVAAAKSLLARVQEEQAAIVTRARKEQERIRNAYQQWALEQIQNYNAVFSKALEAPKDDSHEGRYKKAMWAMIVWLLPIESGLLDPAVGQRYHEAYMKGWNLLDGREDQLFVAQQSAVTPRQSPEHVR